jgi:hypothetical protein
VSNPASSTDFKVGDKVTVPVPLGRAFGTVIEDRGRLGQGGKRLFRVSVPNHPYSTDVFLVDEEEIRHVTQEEQATFEEHLDPEAIKEFLVQGGLISLLVRNTPEPVWLRRGPRNTVTYTFVEGYSSTGGVPPPMYSLHGERIFSGRREAVVDFIKSFGLSNEGAEEVVREVGVAP